MDTRVHIADDKHRKGYNCAQAVACTYCDLVGVDEAVMFKAAEGLGFGMGCMDGTCGAVSAACLLAGFKNSTANLEKPDSKGKTYKLSKAIIKKFTEMHRTVTCKELKGIETGVVLCKCNDCVKDAAKIAEEVLFAE